MRKTDSGSPAGYGPQDRKLAEDLERAASKAEADRIARADGHQDAKGALNWLKGRS